MPIVDAVRVEGFRDLRRGLRALGTEAPRALRVAGNQAAQLVIDRAVPMVPRRSGRAAKSIKARSSQTAVKIASGGRAAPYFPWLDYGGKVGRNDTASRPFVADGRYVYAAYRAEKPKFAEVLNESLRTIADEAGLELD
ncbi:MAG TPA: HK97 gp10 family phage protein [Actinoplanes sp.]|nr:HK97 gp10 family phage protein [Actinoplanes sp.]